MNNLSKKNRNMEQDVHVLVSISVNIRILKE